MTKIPTIFLREFDGDPSRVTREPHPECDWVFAGEGEATRKFDGTCCLYDGNWWKRREVKPGKPVPPDFREEDHDGKTGKRMGWVPVDATDKWHVEAINAAGQVAPGTYELCGPKVQGNPEGLDSHVLISHETAERLEAPRDFDGLKIWLETIPHEGVVFHHPDGRMAKIKRRDFGYR